MGKQTQVYKLYTYDLWGNAKDGWQVNDVYQQQTITINVRGVVYNKGTAYEFISYEPTNVQLNRAIGARGVVWDGESEDTLYGETRSGKPACELRRVE